MSGIEATIARQQAAAEALSQRYDGAEQRLQSTQTAITATAAALTKTRSTLAADKARLARDAVNAYVFATPDTRVDALFTSPSGTADARSEYEDTVVGNLTADVAAEKAAQAKLDAQKARQQVEAAQANAAAAQAKSLEAQNADATAGAEATLQQVKGTLAQEVAAAAVQEAQQQAAAAAAAKSAAQQQAERGGGSARRNRRGGGRWLAGRDGRGAGGGHRDHRRLVPEWCGLIEHEWGCVGQFDRRRTGCVGVGAIDHVVGAIDHLAGDICVIGNGGILDARSALGTCQFGRKTRRLRAGAVPPPCRRRPPRSACPTCSAASPRERDSTALGSPSGHGPRRA